MTVERVSEWHMPNLKVQGAIFLPKKAKIADIKRILSDFSGLQAQFTLQGDFSVWQGQLLQHE